MMLKNTYCVWHVFDALPSVKCGGGILALRAHCALLLDYLPQLQFAGTTTHSLEVHMAHRREGTCTRHVIQVSGLPHNHSKPRFMRPLAI